MYELRKYHPAAWELFLTHKNSFLLKHLVDTLLRGVADNLFWPGLDVEVLARLRLAQLDLLLDPEFYPQAQPNTLLQLIHPAPASSSRWYDL